MSIPDPEVDLTALTATLTGRTQGTNLFRGPELAADTSVPADCIFVVALPGGRPMPLLGSGTDLRSADVRFVVRGPPQDRETARTTARALLEGVQRATSGGLSGYALALLTESEPAYEDYDASLCHYYSFSLMVQWVK